MNHLAHLLLSCNNEELMVGGFIADAVKGNKYLNYEKEISRGILLHRFIDHFTDTHPEVSELKKFVRPSFGLFSGVVIDIAYDHLLAKHWIAFNSESLTSFSLNAYLIFEKHVSIMPERNRQLLPFMRKENWLLNYATIEGIDRTFKGMARRIKNFIVVDHQ